MSVITFYYRVCAGSRSIDCLLLSRLGDLEFVLSVQEDLFLFEFMVRHLFLVSYVVAHDNCVHVRCLLTFVRFLYPHFFVQRFLMAVLRNGAVILEVPNLPVVEAPKG